MIGFLGHYVFEHHRLLSEFEANSVLEGSTASWGYQCSCLLSCRWNMLILYLLWVGLNSHESWIHWSSVFLGHIQCSVQTGSKGTEQTCISAHCTYLLCSQSCFLCHWASFTTHKFKDKLWRISRKGQQSIKPNRGSFWMWAPVRLHRSHTHETSPAWPNFKESHFELLPMIMALYLVRKIKHYGDKMLWDENSRTANKQFHELLHWVEYFLYILILVRGEAM